ncbi:uncharacterized protein BN804_00756 [Firmicutes bacterium CAG:884]|nr:uncharacterized protein BN804_00756 [Firmicutes bacterium CAG:884]
MKKKTILYAVAIALLVLIFGIFIKLNSNKQVSTINSASDMKKMLNTIYSNAKTDLPSLSTEKVDLSNTDIVTSYTGLKTANDIDLLVVSEPLINAQAYLVAVIKVKDNVDVEKVKTEIYDNIDMRRWICVSAEKLYITNNGNVIFLVMADDNWAKPVYDEFKAYVNNSIGKELEKTNDEGSIELPPEMPAA